MSGLSGFSEEEVARAIFEGTDTSLATGDIYVSLHTADEGNSPTGENEIDSDTTNYSRVAVPAADWDVEPEGPTEVTNNAEISFGDPDSTWGDITHFCIWTEDEGVEGEEPYVATTELDTAQTGVDENTDEVRFDVGALTANIE